MQPIKTDPQSGILYRQWQAASSKAALLLVHGLGGHGARWQFFGDYFLQANFSSYAIELKGFGETPDLKGHVDSFDIYYSDLRSLCGIIKKENPGKKVFLIGESMGGLIAFRLAIQEPQLFEGVVCMVPTFSSGMKFPPSYYVKVFASLLYNPRKQFIMPFTSQMCTKDEEYQKVMDASPLEHRFATTRLLINILIEQIRALMLKDKLKIPVLFQISGKDQLVDERVGRKVFYSMKAKDKEIIEYPDLRHALPIELERKKVFDDVLNWLQGRI